MKVLENTYDGLLNINKSKVIDSITENQDSYSFRELNCFTKPLAILAESFKPCYFDIFLFHITFFDNRVIDFRNIGDESESAKLKPFESFVQYFSRYVSPRINLSIEEIGFSTKEQLINKIVNEINQNGRILIPGDLYELYYDEHYKRQHHSHYFIIKGYDLERRIFFILDNHQLEIGGSIKYKDFVIEFDSLYKITKQFYNHNFPSSSELFFLSMHQKESGDLINISNALLDHYKFLKSEGYESVKYPENEVFKLIQEKGINSTSEAACHKMNATANSRTVYYDILFKFLTNLKAKQTLIDKLVEIKDDLMRNWMLLRNKIIYCCYKGSQEIGKQEVLLKKCIDMEQIFKENLVELLASLDLNNNIERDALQNDKFSFVEKNTKKIRVEKINNNIAILHFGTMAYNTWAVQDNAPQFLKLLTSNNNFSIETKVIVPNGSGKNYQSGIIIRFTDGGKLLYGLESGNRITLLCPELNEKCMLFESSFISDSVYLKMEKFNDAYTFSYKSEWNEQWINSLIYHRDGLASSFGLFSKTWEPIELKVEFVDIKFLVSD